MPIPVTLTTNGVAVSRGNTKVSASAGEYGSHMVMKNIDTPIRADANPVENPSQPVNRNMPSVLSSDSSRCADPGCLDMSC